MGSAQDQLSCVRDSSPEDELRCKQLDEQDGATPHLDAPIVE